MKKFRAMALVAAAVLLLPYNVKSAGVNDPNATDQPPSVSEAASPDESAAQTAAGPPANLSVQQTPADETAPQETPVPSTGTQSVTTTDPAGSAASPSADQSAANGALQLPNANPTYSIELTGGSVNITYPNHKTAVHDKKYIPLIVNGTLIDSEVILVNNRTLAPIRVLTEALGGTVDWDDATRTATIHKGNDIIIMTIGSTAVSVNGVNTTIDVPADIYNNATYLPLRFVAEALGADVSYSTGDYDPSTMTYKSYMLVQGVSANATIDQKDPSWPVYSKFQAQSTIMALSKNLFNQFSKQNDADNPGKDFTSKYNFILSNIDNTRVVGSVSRYYVVESFCLFLFDKYTGTIYTTGSNSTSNWVKRYADGDPDNAKLFTDAYFFNTTA